MKNHHLQLNLAKTELMVFPAKQAIHHNISINIDSLSLVPSKTARNLWVIIDDQLTFTDHIASVSRSCRFALFNIRKIRPYLTQYATQLLVQTLVSSRLDYCNALLTGLPACVVKPLQMIQNAAARLVFNQPKRAHVTPLLIELHWLPVAARIKFKSLMLAYRVIAGLALPSVQERQSRLFSFIVPRWWNELPSTTRAGASHSTFKTLWKTQLFREHLPS